MSKKANKKGICQLTGDIGMFQRSHILPKAVTKLSEHGERYMEASLNSPIYWRANSWYDYYLVTEKGEKILSEIDGAAIAELRKHSLIWSGFGPKWRKTPPPDSYKLPDEIRYLVGCDFKLLRLFFLSLLWRAAASKRKEMNDINLTDNELTNLKTMILKKDAGDPFYFPIYINQISTIGIHHNRTPIYEKVYLLEDIKVDTFRFYFEGLTAHIIHSKGEVLNQTFEHMFLGASDLLIVATHTFENSRASDNLQEVISSVGKNI